MKIGVIGLGNIAQKAYLPVMLTQHPEVDWHLCTRNQEKLEQIGKQYRIDKLFTDLDEFTDSGIEGVFVHTPTATHYDVIKQFIHKGIHVYVDKPISEDLDQTKELLELAEEKNVLLMTGFNRRFAPMLDELKKMEDKQYVSVQKNRQGSSGRNTRFMIYDLFIHPLDTALYLLDGEVESIQSTIVGTKDNFQRAWVMIESKDTTVSVSVNTEAGANLEFMEVQSKNGTMRLENLDQLTTRIKNTDQTTRYSDWTPTLHKRGFEPIIQAFLDALKTKKSPVTPKSAWLSHKICEEMLKKEGY
ncbi:Gfo/Idh/MocA family protein [Lacticigenium naphthae]|uniref:Gfo/Idh/MocA family protein n=1 Tax=Lacticigenium naphthae TaxID=515351 RepID=UPI0003FFDD4E|nr:Gfo/Idh/MocA family oxidoreductase [Lacticigenium naphthae]